MRCMMQEQSNILYTERTKARNWSPLEGPRGKDLGDRGNGDNLLGEPLWGLSKWFRYSSSSKSSPSAYTMASPFSSGRADMSGSSAGSAIDEEADADDLGVSKSSHGSGPAGQEAIRD